MPDLSSDTIDIQRRLMSMVGFPHAVNNGGIAPEYAVGLFRAILRKSPAAVLEVGMANGASTLTILSALSQLGGDRLLISIDPSQSAYWSNVGVKNVQANGFSRMHRLIEEPDYLALPKLVEQKLTPDATYIDGRHTFDHVLLDFFYVDKLLTVGGIVGFTDAGWRAIRRVLRFMATHRRYRELDVGIKPNYVGRNIVASIGRRVLKVVNNDRWFEKAAAWEPNGNFYASF
jgi:predicted O-methyltransferase YrrM